MELDAKHSDFWQKNNKEFAEIQFNSAEEEEILKKYHQKTRQEFIAYNLWWWQANLQQMIPELKVWLQNRPSCKEGVQTFFLKNYQLPTLCVQFVFQFPEFFHADGFFFVFYLLYAHHSWHIMHQHIFDAMLKSNYT